MDSEQNCSLIQKKAVPLSFKTVHYTFLQRYLETEEPAIPLLTKCVETQEDHGELSPNSTDSMCSCQVDCIEPLCPSQGYCWYFNAVNTLWDYSRPVPV